MTDGPSALYGAPLYGEPYGSPLGPPLARRNGMGVAALVCGIVGVFGAVVVVPGVVLGALALVFGLVGRRRAKRHEADNRGVATAGVVLGTVALVFSALALWGYIWLFTSDAGKDYLDCMETAQTSQESDACAQDLIDRLSDG